MADESIVRVVVASPGDVPGERRALQEVIEGLNESLAVQLRKRLVLCRWETDAHPGFHVEGPQGLLDPILNVEACDVFIGLFWTRFGTPVTDAASGTEHEFRRAYASWKNTGRPKILFYFSERSYVLTTEAELEQLRRVLRFKEEFPKEGMWWSYKNPAHFKDLVRKHLGRLLAAHSSSPPVPETEPQQLLLLGFESLKTLLSDKYTFESFVVGSCNQFAHAAAQAVAAKPYSTYNPLFVYGGVGMGKTHLMHAIGNSLSCTMPSARVVYASSERFANQLINCIRQDRTQWFHNYYRTADVLLIDDIQFLAGKDSTQEEFLYTLNDLVDRQKQIVITSDGPPRDLSGFMDRLRSTFEWGLLVDLQPPDIETKMAILTKKAEMEGVQLPEDVRAFIATKTKSNIRELEGALVRLLATNSMTGRPIDLSMAQQVLSYLMHSQSRKVTFEQIIKSVCERFNVAPAALKSKSNAKEVVYPRQIAVYLAKELTGASLPEIGRVFGRKHHTTVLLSIKKIEFLRQRDTELNRTLHELLDRLA